MQNKLPKLCTIGLIILALTMPASGDKSITIVTDSTRGIQIISSPTNFTISTDDGSITLSYPMAHQPQLYLPDDITITITAHEDTNNLFYNMINPPDVFFEISNTTKVLLSGPFQAGNYTTERVDYVIGEDFNLSEVVKGERFINTSDLFYVIGFNHTVMPIPEPEPETSTTALINTTETIITNTTDLVEVTTTSVESIPEVPGSTIPNELDIDSMAPIAIASLVPVVAGIFILRGRK